MRFSCLRTSLLDQNFRILISDSNSLFIWSYQIIFLKQSRILCDSNVIPTLKITEKKYSIDYPTVIEIV